MNTQIVNNTLQWTRKRVQHALCLAVAALANLSSLSSMHAQDMYESDNYYGDAKVILNGQLQVRSIHLAGNPDWIRFTIGPAGATNFRIETDGFSIHDTEMTLYGPDNPFEFVAYDDDGGNELFSRISHDTLRSGNYYVRVSEFFNNEPIPVYTLHASWSEGLQLPDLTRGSDSINTTSASPGETIRIDLRVRNNGNAPSTWPMRVQFYVNKDVRSTAFAAKIGERELPILAAGALSQPISFSWTVPANLPPGNYSIGYWIDAPGFIIESNETNNQWFWDNIRIIVEDPWHVENVNWRVDYGNSWNKFGTIMKAGAREVRVHFREIDTEFGFDRLTSNSGNDWTGRYVDVTSSSKNGSSLNLTLTSDGSITGYFMIDRVEWRGTSTSSATRSGSLFESGDDGVWRSENVNWRVDYQNNWDRIGTITKLGASRVRVHFREIETETTFDYLFSDSGESWSGSFSNVTTKPKSGNSLRLTLESDPSIRGYFIIDRIDWQGVATGPASFTGSLFEFR